MPEKCGGSKLSLQCLYRACSSLKTVLLRSVSKGHDLIPFDLCAPNEEREGKEV